MDFGSGMTNTKADEAAAKRESELAAEKKAIEDRRAAEEAARRGGLRGARSLISRAYGASGADTTQKSDTLA